MAKLDPEREAHKAWLGLIQPVGLVVSPPALIKAQVVLDKNVIPVQQAFQAVVVKPASLFGDADPVLLNFPRFATDVLGWSPADLAGVPDGPPVPDALAVALPTTARPCARPTPWLTGWPRARCSSWSRSWSTAWASINLRRTTFAEAG